ncbi:unnamed protein product [Prunus armeniaca]
MFTLEKCFIVDSDFKIVLSGVRTRDNCCHVDAGSDSSSVCHKASDDTLTLWHQLLGHINFRELEKLSKRETVKGLPKLNSKVVGICGLCQLGKQVRNPHKKSEGIVTSQPLELVYMDLVILSYSLTSKAYRVFNKRTQTIVESINVIVDDSSVSLKLPNDDHDSLDDIGAHGGGDHEKESENRDGVKTRKQLEEGMSFVCYVSKFEPNNVIEALSDADWILAMQNDVWYLMPRPKSDSSSAPRLGQGGPKKKKAFQRAFFAQAGCGLHKPGLALRQNQPLL